MFQIPNGIKITNAQERNIRKLSSYALNLPEDYKHFDMEDYCTLEGDNQIDLSRAKKILSATCNTGVCDTSGCLLGHGPVAGIKPRPKQTWNQYSTHKFGIERAGQGWDVITSREWEWCFSSYWGNKASDGALRLLYWLDYGVPAVFENGRNEKHCTRKVRKAYVIT